MSTRSELFDEGAPLPAIPAPAAYAARVLRTLTSDTELVDVVLDTSDPGIETQHTGLAWPPRKTTLPAAEDPCLVMFDATGRASVVVWLDAPGNT